MDGKFNELLPAMEKIFAPYIEDIDVNFQKYNAKAVLQEYTQGLSKEIPVYQTLNESGPAHEKIFTIEVLYKGEAIAQGQGRTKKEAEQAAALQACEKLGIIPELKKQNSCGNREKPAKRRSRIKCAMTEKGA
jgi:ribonuclease-3